MSKRSLKNKVYPHKRVRNATVYLNNRYQIIHQNHSIVEIAQWIVEYIWTILNKIIWNYFVYFDNILMLLLTGIVFSYPIFQKSYIWYKMGSSLLHEQIFPRWTLKNELDPILCTFSYSTVFLSICILHIHR